jgi:hypothetical protein
MPTVPTEFVPSVGATAPNMPPVQAPAVEPVRNAKPQQIEQLGGAMAQAGTAAATIGQGVAFKIQNEIDDAKVKSAETQFIQQASDVSNKYLTTQNADALAGYQPTQEAIVKAKQDVLGTLDNDLQRRMFSQVASRHLISFGEQLANHQAVQRKNYTITESLARADSMRAMNQNVPVGSKDQAAQTATGVSEILNAYAGKGYPADSEEAKKAVRDYQTGIVGDNVNRLMTSEQYGDAKTLLGEQVAAGNVDPQIADQLRKSIESNVKRVETDNKADEIFANGKGDLKIANLQSMLAKAGEIEDPEMRKDVQSQVSAQFAQAGAIQSKAYNENLNAAVNYKAAHNGSIRGIDPTVWAALQPKDQADLKDSPPVTKNNFDVLANFATNPDTLTVDAVKQAHARGQLTDDMTVTLLGRATTLENKPEKIQEAGAVDERIKYFAGQSGVNVSPKATADKETWVTLQYKIQNDIDKIKTENNGKATAQQVDDAIKAELVKHTLTMPRSPWNPLAILGSPNSTTDKFTFQMPSGATHVVPGSDGKMHYTDGKTDLGLVQ